MHFKTVQIVNYKGFADSTPVRLHQHVNVLVGQNSAGKSAFLEAFDLSRSKLKNTPHRNLENPRGGGASEFIFTVGISGAEFFDFALVNGLHLVVRPTSQMGSMEEMFESARNSDWEFVIAAIGGGDIGSISTRRISVGGKEHIRGRGMMCLSAAPDPTRTSFQISGSTDEDTTAQALALNFRAKVFPIKADKYRIGRCPAVADRALQPDAVNFAICLMNLHRNRQLFDRYVRMVRQVLPQIVDLSAAPDRTEATQVEVVIYNSETDRPELGIPLDDCGTGVAQVLVILFIVATMRSAVIVIDEPTSFLHPSAAKSLMRIIRSSRDQQFIIATHSAEVIAALAPEAVIDVRWSAPRHCSVIETLDARAVRTKKSLLENLGVAFSDMFGTETVIWVEGPTEAACFDLLLDAANPERSAGLSFLAMPWASKADSKSDDAVRDFFRLHAKAASGAALWPSSVWFHFDAETRSPQQQAEIIKLSANRASFLPRRLYENYLLHPKALVALLDEIDPVGEYREEAVADWLESKLEQFRGKAPPTQSLEVATDAARAIQALVAEFTETRFEYSKVEHGRWLTEWLLQHDRPHLAEVIDYVQSLATNASTKSTV